jgi:CubicO group peptidase (beta-lactamase class C family)
MMLAGNSKSSIGQEFTSTGSLFVPFCPVVVFGSTRILGTQEETMKKVILISFGMALLTFVGCGGEGSNGNNNDNNNNQMPSVNLRVGEPVNSIQEFETRLESIRSALYIPGMSAAVAKGGQVVWAKGFGYADVENQVPVDPTTPFHLASLTKPFASVLIMQLVEAGMLDLQEPISTYGIDLGSSYPIGVIHLLTHTSEGEPGSYYNYNGNRFTLLDKVIQGVSGKSFCELLVEEIIDPLQLEHTAPSPRTSANCMLTTQSERDAFELEMPVGYTSNGERRVTYPSYFGSSAGLVASALDMAEFSLALDKDMFFSQETKERMFTPMVSNSGETLPYGMGWFIHWENNLKIIRHYGYWTAISSLIIKVPEKDVTFVLMANNDMLSRASYGIGSDSDVTRSVPAEEFLNGFVFGDAELPTEPYSR